jgi:nitrate/nitrite transporter NarK
MQFLRDLWGGLTDRLSAEPVMVLAVIQMGVALGVSFGLRLSADQVGAVVAFSAAVLGLVARTKVSPA